MRIAVWHNLPSGGGKRALYDHVAGLVAAGHEVEAWAPPTIDRDYLPLDTLVREHIVPLDWLTDLQFLEKLQVRLDMRRAVRAMDEHCRRCAEQIAAGGFDVLYANACQFFRTTAIARYVDLPSAIYLGEPYRWLYEAMPEPVWMAPPDDALRVTSPASLKRAFANVRMVRNARIQMREEIRNAAAFDRILCNSLFSRESILRAYGLDAEVCYLGIDEQHFHPGSEERDQFVLGLGAFTHEKNLSLCIRAVGEMRAPRPRLVWIGNVGAPEFIAEMTALARSLDVVFEPRRKIPDAEVQALLGSATALVYAPRLEPFGLAPLEANACATPVVAIAEGGVRETVLDGVNGLVAAPNARGIAAGLQAIFDDPALGRRLGRQGRELVERRWSRDAATQRLVAALEGVIDD